MMLKKNVGRTMCLAISCCALAIAQQTSTTTWSVNDVSVGTRSEIQSDIRTLKPNAGSILLDVKAVIGSADPERLVIEVSQIYVQVSGGAKSELVGIGLTGNDGACVYQTTEGMQSGFASTSDRSGNGYKLGRKTKDEPLAITLTKTPDRLCLAFLVPEKSNGKMVLHVGGATIPVSLGQPR